MHKILFLTLIATLLGEPCSAQEFSATGILFASPMNNGHNSRCCQQQELFLQGGDMPNTDERYANLGESLLTGRFSDEEISSLFTQIVRPGGDVDYPNLFRLLISIDNAITNGEQTASETGKPIIRSRKTGQTLTISPALSNGLIALIRDGIDLILDEIVSNNDPQRLGHAFYTIIEAVPNILDDEVIRSQIANTIIKKGVDFLDNIVLRLILESNPTHYTNCMSKLMDILTQELNRKQILDIFKQWSQTQGINFQLFVVNFCSEKYGLDNIISQQYTRTINTELLLTHAGIPQADHADNITLLAIRDKVADYRSSNPSSSLAVMLQNSELATEENLDNQQQTEENGNDDDMPPLEEFDGNSSEETNEAQQPVSKVIEEPSSETPTGDKSKDTQEEDPQSPNKTADKDVTNLDDDDGSKKSCVNCVVM